MEQLQRTLQAEPELLEARPLIALPDGTVVAGNQRLVAAIALGWETIPVVYADLSPEEVAPAFTDRDDIVYEPFAGSGTTLIAAEQAGRRCFAMEIDPAYCDVIRQRYADYVGDQSYAP